MVTKDGIMIDIHESRDLIETTANINQCEVYLTRHEILGHCNYEDIQKLQRSKRHVDKR